MIIKWLNKVLKVLENAQKWERFLRIEQMFHFSMNQIVVSFSKMHTGHHSGEKKAQIWDFLGRAP